MLNKTLSVLITFTLLTSLSGCGSTHSNIKSVNIPLKSAHNSIDPPTITVPNNVENRNVVPYFVDFNKPIQDGDYVEIYNGNELVGRYVPRKGAKITRISSRFRALHDSLNVKVFTNGNLIASSNKSFSTQGQVWIRKDADSSTEAKIISEYGKFKALIKNNMGTDGYLKVLEVKTNNGTIFIENTHLAPANPFYGVSGNFNNATIAGAYLSTASYPVVIPPQSGNKSGSQNKSISTATGTGWLTEYGVIVTNHHVIEDANNISVLINGETVEAKVLSSDPQNDVAILTVQSNEKLAGLKAIQISSNPGNLAEKVFTIGYPLTSKLGSSPKYSSGEISSVKGILNDPTSYQITVPINAGNSGGPLLTEDGVAIGITTAALSSTYFLKRGGNVPQNVNFAVKSAYILPLIQAEGLSKTIKPNLVKDMKRQELVENLKGSVLLIMASE